MKASLALQLFALIASVLAGDHPECRNSQGDVVQMECTVRTLPPNCTMACETEEMRASCLDLSFMCYIRNRYEPDLVNEMLACPVKPSRCRNAPICKTGAHCWHKCTDTIVGWDCVSPGDDWICDEVPCSWDRVYADFLANGHSDYSEDSADEEEQPEDVEHGEAYEQIVRPFTADGPSPDANVRVNFKPGRPGRPVRPVRPAGPVDAEQPVVDAAVPPAEEHVAELAEVPEVEEPANVPVVEQPAEVPAIEQPAEVPAVEQPENVPEPEQPAEQVAPEVAQPIAEQPIVEQPAAEQPIEQPAAEQPVVEQPVPVAEPIAAGLPPANVDPTEPAEVRPEAVPEPVVEQVQIPNYETTGWE